MNNRQWFVIISGLMASALIVLVAFNTDCILAGRTLVASVDSGTDRVRIFRDCEGTGLRVGVWIDCDAGPQEDYRLIGFVRRAELSSIEFALSAGLDDTTFVLFERSTPDVALAVRTKQDGWIWPARGGIGTQSITGDWLRKAMGSNRWWTSLEVRPGAAKVGY